MALRTWTLIATLIAGHLVIDLIAPQLFFGAANEWLLIAMLGLCVGQITLIGVWAAMAPGRVMLRLPWSLLLATLMWYALVLGNRMHGAFSEYDFLTFHAEDALLLGLVLLAGVSFVQIPLWIASRLLGWRLMSPRSSDDAAVDERQFNIKHLIVGMFLVSIALGLGRIVMPAGDWKLSGLEYEFMIILPTIGVVNLIVAVPCIWGAFAHWKLLIPLAFGWVLYALIVSIVEVGVLIAFLGSPGDDSIWLIFTLFNVAQCLSVFGTLAALRLIGFQLVRTRHQPQVEEKTPVFESPVDVR